MAALDETNRWRVWAQAMREQALTGGWTVSKADLRAAVNAVDDWVEANTTSFNTALPQPFRSAATSLQKSLLLCWVVMRRAGIHRAEED